MDKERETSLILGYLLQSTFGELRTAADFSGIKKSKLLIHNIVSERRQAPQGTYTE